MAEELYRDDFGAIIFHPEDGILELEWFENSARMTDDDFMRSMERYAAFAEERRAPNMLVDVTRFGHAPGEQVGAWRDEHILPRYNAAGVQKFAFLVPPGAPGTVEGGGKPERESPGDRLLRGSSANPRLVRRLTAARAFGLRRARPPVSIRAAPVRIERETPARGRQRVEEESR